MKWMSKKFWAAIGIILAIVLVSVGVEIEGDALTNILEAIRTILETVME